MPGLRPAATHKCFVGGEVRMRLSFGPGGWKAKDQARGSEGRTGGMRGGVEN